MGRSIVPIEVGSLRDNQRNTFRFRAGNQDRDCPGTFSWGLYHVYSFIVRIYYDDSVAHPTGRISSPSNGATVGESPIITIDTTGSPVPVESVDLIAKYNDFDWDGNGIYREWQYRFEQRRGGSGNMTRHIGTKEGTPPYIFAWDTTWVPDQDQPVELMARIRGTNGVYYMTPAVSVNFERDGRSVKMFTVNPEDMEENFGVRDGRTRKDVPINVTMSNPRADAGRARLVMSTWAGRPRYSSEPGYISTEIEFNGEPIIRTTPTSSRQMGREYDYGDVELDLTAAALQTLTQGDNKFEMLSNRTGHAFEVHLPGPALKIDYGDGVVTSNGVVTTKEDRNVNISLIGSSSLNNNIAFGIPVPPTNGTLSGSGSNRIYTPDADFSGVDRFTFQVRDTVTNRTATGEITIIVDAVDTSENNAPQVNAGNDITISEGATITQAGSFTDPDSSSWTVTANYGDGSGTQTLTPNGNQFSLEHTYVDNGEYTVTVSVNDGSGGVGTDTLLVTVNNVAPEVSAVGEQSAKRGEPIELSLATFTDPGTDDTHSATIDWGDGSEPTAGVINQTDNTVSGSHTYAENGTYTINVTVEDDDGDSGNASMQITIVDNPVIAREDSVTTNVGEAVTINVLENDEGGEGTVRTVEITAEPENGTAVVNEDNTITYTPNDGFSGMDTFSYTVADEIGTRASAAVTVTVGEVVVDTNSIYLPLIVH